METDPRRPIVSRRERHTDKHQALSATALVVLHTPNIVYRFDESLSHMPLERLGIATRTYQQEQHMLPSMLRVHNFVYDVLVPFLVPYPKARWGQREGHPHYFLDGTMPILVSTYDRLLEQEVECVGSPKRQTDGLAIPMFVPLEEEEEKRAYALPPHYPAD